MREPSVWQAPRERIIASAMASKNRMLTLARWHIWLGWLVGVPILMWTVTGLVMVARPIEQVRGEHLRIERSEQTIPRDVVFQTPFLAADRAPVQSFTTEMLGDVAITRVAYADGSNAVFNAETGARLSPFDADYARRLTMERIASATSPGTIPRMDNIAGVRSFAADKVPFDFRRPIPVWQVALEDGTHVYVGAETGQIEAVRTHWWRLFDFMWGLHIMDLQSRKDTSHPILILFTALSVIGATLGCTLMFRRRKGRPVL